MTLGHTQQREVWHMLLGVIDNGHVAEWFNAAALKTVNS